MMLILPGYFTPAVNVDLMNVCVGVPAQVEAWPGRNFDLPLKGLDELKNPTAVSARFTIVGNVRRMR